ncbi:unnamed protein product [Gadus morhua 'NCC']
MVSALPADPMSREDLRNQGVEVERLVSHLLMKVALRHRAVVPQKGGGAGDRKWRWRSPPGGEQADTRRERSEVTGRRVSGGAGRASSLRTSASQRLPLQGGSLQPGPQTDTLLLYSRHQRNDAIMWTKSKLK